MPMSKGRPTRTYTIVRTIRKFFVSAFVIFSFVAYAVHERFGGSSGEANAIAPAQSPSPTQPVATQQVAPTAAAKGAYKDGEDTGDAADAYFGHAKDTATIQNGQAHAAQVLAYPNVL